MTSVSWIKTSSRSKKKRLKRVRSPAILITPKTARAVAGNYFSNLL